MLQKQTYKVLAVLPRRDGVGTWFMRIGNAFPNKDGSINVYLDVVPVVAVPGKPITIQLRALDESDLRQRELHRETRTADAPSAPASV